MTQSFQSEPPPLRRDRFGEVADDGRLLQPERPRGSSAWVWIVVAVAVAVPLSLVTLALLVGMLFWTVAAPVPPAPAVPIVQPAERVEEAP